MLPPSVLRTVLQRFLCADAAALLACSQLSRSFRALLRPSSLLWARVVLAQFDFRRIGAGESFADGGESPLRLWNGIVVDARQWAWLADLQTHFYTESPASVGNAIRHIVDKMPELDHFNNPAIHDVALALKHLLSTTKGLFWRDLYFSIHKLLKLQSRISDFRFFDAFGKLTNVCHPVLVLDHQAAVVDVDDMSAVATAAGRSFELLSLQVDSIPHVVEIRDSADLIDLYKYRINHIDLWEAQESDDFEGGFPKHDEIDVSFWGVDGRPPQSSKSFVNGLLLCCKTPMLFVDSMEELENPIMALLGKIGASDDTIIAGGFIATYWFY
ncbi:hypothetical protein BDR26DRAFT_861182 [Obelidium mucronatum]|nr:hypothetical protein BDR26DRAFT_861182 [Obelidium mucronatum]